MTVECNDCKSLRFPKESSHLCCANGKVSNLELFDEPPNEIKHLWTDTT